MSIKLLLLGALALTSVFAAVANASTPPPDLDALIRNSRETRIISAQMPAIDQWIDSGPDSACDYLVQLADRGNVQANGLLRQVLMRHRDNVAVREKLIDYYLKRFSPEDLNYDMSKSQLLEFRASEFTTKTREIIRAGLHAENPRSNFVLATGIADMRSEIPYLQAMMSRADRSTTDSVSLTQKIDARMALARMGDMEQAQMIIDLARREVARPDRTAILHLHFVGYIRQPVAIGYLKEVLNGNEAMVNPISFNLPGEPYANVALDILTRCISGFPVQWKPGRAYGPNDVSLAREWMAQQTNLEIIR